ncbi:MAG: alpha/beta hydrolase [Geitlerinemataceae cyanobacterium]
MALSTIVVPAASGTPKHTLVLLHGWGANERDLASIAQELALPDCQCIFPNGTFEHGGMPGSRMWYALGPQLEFDIDPEGIQASRTAIETLLVRVAAETGVPLPRTVLGGFSQGGAMALDIGSRLPLAGFVSMSGYLHGPIVQAETIAKPALVMHGSADPVVPLAAAGKVREALAAAGIKAQFAEFAIGHGICPEEIAVLRKFLADVFEAVG